MIKFLVLLGLCFTSTAHAASDANGLWQASEAKSVARELGTAAPSQTFKAALLESARSEDREFVKGMIVGWKKNRAREVRSEFNILILRDDQGAELLRMGPVENESGKFRINGQVWSVPEKGSISNSLMQLLQKKTARRSTDPRLWAVLAFGEPAYAVDEKSPIVNAAYLYSSLLHSKKSGGANIWAAITSQPIEVQCSINQASGRVKIANQIFKFTAATDGSVVMIPLTNPDPRMSFKAEIKDGALAYRSCADKDCFEPTSLAKSSLKTLIKSTALVDVDVATSFRARDSHEGKYPIEFACEDKSDCFQMEIRDLEKMSQRDKEWAVKYRDRANEALAKFKAESNEIVRSLEPLASCCQQSACTEAVAANRIKLTPIEAVRSARTDK